MDFAMFYHPFRGFLVRHHGVQVLLVRPVNFRSGQKWKWHWATSVVHLVMHYVLFTLIISTSTYHKIVNDVPIGNH